MIFRASLLRCKTGRRLPARPAWAPCSPARGAMAQTLVAQGLPQHWAQLLFPAFCEITLQMGILQGAGPNTAIRKDQCRSSSMRTAADQASRLRGRRPLSGQDGGRPARRRHRGEEQGRQRCALHRAPAAQTRRADQGMADRSRASCNGGCSFNRLSLGKHAVKPLALALLGSLAAVSVSPAAPGAPVPAGTPLILVDWQEPQVAAAALAQPLCLRFLERPRVLLRPLRIPIPGLLLLASILRLLPRRFRLLRLERIAALPPVMNCR